MTHRALLETTQALLRVEATAQPSLLMPDLPMSCGQAESPDLQSDTCLLILPHSAALQISRLINVSNRNWLGFDWGGLGWKGGGGPCAL